MKQSLLWLAIAAMATAACVDQRSHLRRAQRPEDALSFWQIPGYYGRQGLDALSSFAPSGNLIPTAAVSAESDPIYYETGLAPIFNVFRDEMVSEQAPPTPFLPMDAASRVASANSGAELRPPMQNAPRDSAPERPSPETAPEPAPLPELPIAVAVPGKPGIVTIPGRAGLGEIDVVGIPSGTPVEVPYGGGTVQFRVP